jgi:hypothetical protein
VTEVQWLACNDPRRMLEEWIAGYNARKLQLLACACCRRVVHQLADAAFLRAVEVAEQYADGTASDSALAEAREAARDACMALERSHGTAPRQVLAAQAVVHAAAGDGRSTNPFFMAVRRAVDAVSVAGWLGRDRPGERQPFVLLVHDVFGNPYRMVSGVGSWLAWGGGIIPRLAQAAYDERALPHATLDGGRLAVLADALEEAGCSNAAILGHLRGPGPHARGCWVLDLVLGR